MNENWCPAAADKVRWRSPNGKTVNARIVAETVDGFVIKFREKLTLTPVISTVPIHELSPKDWSQWDPKVGDTVLWKRYQNPPVYAKISEKLEGAVQLRVITQESLSPKIELAQIEDVFPEDWVFGFEL